MSFPKLITTRGLNLCTALTGNITNTKQLEMNYANYDDKIVIPYKIKLVGHPFNVKNPSDITTISELRTLRSALKCGECKRVRLTEAELDTHMKALEPLRKDGKVGKARKPRSDAGVPRGSRKRARGTEDGNDENIDPSNKKRKLMAGAKTAAGRGKEKKKALSKEIVDSDSDEDALDG